PPSPDAGNETLAGQVNEVWSECTWKRRTGYAPLSRILPVIGELGSSLQPFSLGRTFRRSCLLPGIDPHLLNGRHGEGFRMPAIAGRTCRHGPACGNLPSTNPRGTSATLWGFENSGGAVQAAR